jgi:hypothetical protein
MSSFSFSHPYDEEGLLNCGQVDIFLELPMQQVFRSFTFVTFTFSSAEPPCKRAHPKKQASRRQEVST